MAPRPPLRVALIGWGAIAQTAADLFDETVEVVAVAVRDPGASRPDLPIGARLLTNPTELLECNVDVVAEAAGRDSVAQWGSVSLAAGVDFVVSSVSAFADTSLLARMTETARVNGARLILQPGALAGVEALAAAKLMGVDSVEHRIIKPPRAWLGTPAETLCDLGSLHEPTMFFSANAAETASAFPKNANVAMTTALAGIGPEATTIKLIADPKAATNRHELSAHGAFGKLDVAIANSPLPANPKTSALAALSLVRTIANQASALVI